MTGKAIRVCNNLFHSIASFLLAAIRANAKSENRLERPAWHTISPISFFANWRIVINPVCHWQFIFLRTHVWFTGTLIYKMERARIATWIFTWASPRYCRRAPDSDCRIARSYCSRPRRPSRRPWFPDRRRSHSGRGTLYPWSRLKPNLTVKKRVSLFGNAQDCLGRVQR